MTSATMVCLLRISATITPWFMGLFVHDICNHYAKGLRIYLNIYWIIVYLYCKNQAKWQDIFQLKIQNKIAITFSYTCTLYFWQQQLVPFASEYNQCRTIQHMVLQLLWMGIGHWHCVTFCENTGGVSRCQKKHLEIYCFENIVQLVAQTEKLRNASLGAKIATQCITHEDGRTTDGRWTPIVIPAQGLLQTPIFVHCTLLHK